jgi:hypothetical protein
MMEVPLPGMMIKIYLRLKIGSELHWHRAVLAVVFAVVSIGILFSKSCHRSSVQILKFIIK